MPVSAPEREWAAHSSLSSPKKSCTHALLCRGGWCASRSKRVAEHDRSSIGSSCSPAADRHRLASRGRSLRDEGSWPRKQVWQVCDRIASLQPTRDRFANKLSVKPNCPPLTSKAGAANDAHGPETPLLSWHACSNPTGLPPWLAMPTSEDVAGSLAPTRSSPSCI